MKKYLLGAAALLALAAPGVASAQSADVDLGYANTDASDHTDTHSYSDPNTCNGTRSCGLGVGRESRIFECDWEFSDAVP